MIQYKKILMTLALLITAVGGAWAQSSLDVVEFAVPAAWENDESNVTAADLPGFKASTLDEAKAWTGAPAEGTALLIFAFDGNDTKYIVFNNGKVDRIYLIAIPKNEIYNQTAKLYYTADPNFIDFTWNPATKIGTFTMPAFDVEIAPVYAPTAQWAEVESVKQLPTAIEGIYAGTDDIIVAPGTVANMGNTEDPQGIVMYAVTSTNQATAPALTAFSDALPTAKNIADEGAEVLVWYYIHGFGDPTAEGASAENTFNDSEICTTPIQVTVLSNKFDINFKAANDNTIESGKATVTVGGTAATVSEGKLEGVKMGSEVKVKANTGYKFRKVEVKKGEKLTLTVGDMVLDITGCTTWADVVAKNSDKIEANGPVVVQKDNHDKYIGPSVTTSSPVDTSVNYQWFEAK